MSPRTCNLGLLAEEKVLRDKLDHYEMNIEDTGEEEEEEEEKAEEDVEEEEDADDEEGEEEDEEDEEDDEGIDQANVI
jgi:hypothetical protein